MAAESYLARASGRVTEATLKLRLPARRLAGSVRSAVIKGAVITGAYCILVGSVILSNPWRYYGMSSVIQASAGFAFISAIMDITLIFGLLVKDDKILKYSVCATMAVYMLALPLTLCNILGVMFLSRFDVPLWEMPRFFICLVHLGLLYCLLAELRGDVPPSPGSPPPEAGWLKNNLARTGPPPPAGDESLLKLQVDPQNNARPGSVAVFAPSSCTTAAPVHPMYPPPPAPAPATTVAAPTPASGPASTSEA